MRARLVAVLATMLVAGCGLVGDRVEYLGEVPVQNLILTDEGRSCAFRVEVLQKVQGVLRREPLVFEGTDRRDRAAYRKCKGLQNGDLVQVNRHHSRDPDLPPVYSTWTSGDTVGRLY